MRGVARVELVAVVAVAAGLAAGCGTRNAPVRADKAGGVRGPVVLRLAASDGPLIAESRLARSFAAEVARLSRGSLRVRVTFLAAGDDTPDVEKRTIELVRKGRFDLGWVATRAWDEVGVTSFQALQAPFLVTSYPLLDRVLTGPVAREMLAGLGGEGVVGLALVPGLLRHPIGITRPLVSLSDFAGARVRDLPSVATDALLRALGAAPVHVGNRSFGEEVAHGRIDGEELSIVNAPIAGTLTANVTLFPKVLTLFAGERALAALDEPQRSILRAAATWTLRQNASFPVHTALAFEGVLARQYCHAPGRVVLATHEELAAFARAARPVYAQLRRDPRTRAFIARIRALESSLPEPPPITVPRSCLGPDRSSGSGTPRSPRVLNGTYHRLLTAAAARAFGPPANAPGTRYPVVVTQILRDGRWIVPSEQPPDVGTYTVRGDEVDLRSGGDLMRFTFSRDRDGTLHLRPILPMDRGDQWFMAGAPWRRVGPPVGNVP